MNYWLINSEPSVFGYEDLVRDGKTKWEGVRNYAARNNLRAMKKGDLALFYHSNEGLEVVGIAKVEKEHYPDPTAESGDWSVVDFVPYKKVARPVSINAIKETSEMQNVALVKNGRLSVMPLTEAEFRKILEMGETKM